MSSNRGKGYKAVVRKFSELPASAIDKLFRGQVGPNSISVITVLLHVPIAWLISQGYLGYGGVFLLLVAPLDLLDGALARVQGKESDFGTVLDASLDRLKEILILSAVAYHFALYGNQAGVTLAAATLGLSVLVSYVRAKGEMAVNSRAIEKKSASLVNRSFEFGLMSYELRVAVLGLGLIFAQLDWALWFILIGSSFTVLARLNSTRKLLSTN